MKKFFLRLIRFYQRLPFFLSHSACRFQPTCSEYAYQAISKYGILQGVWMGFTRIIRCHPWTKGGIDPVPDFNN
ncbi:MAG: membrane protein insertion efficiency factor YidD [Candidatus Pacebacteria bacterium]|nr:membrane protein insertion efficiency factor YidD [Candidatus Paceibacterota bacterium]